MSKKLHETAERAMKEALDDYYDGIFDLNYVPEKAGKILEHELDCAGQRVYTRPFRVEDNRRNFSFCRLGFYKIKKSAGGIKAPAKTKNNKKRGLYYELYRYEETD